MNKVEYFERSESWAIDNKIADARSRRIAWTVAGAALGLAMLEAVALAMLAPLKTVQPITLLVDRHTGYVQALDPVTPRRVAADEVLTQSFLAQYVSAREGYDRATVSADYRRVALMSAGRARSTYLAQMAATNPDSPVRRYGPGTVVAARVKSISKLSEGTAIVRFDLERQDQSSYQSLSQPWVAVIRYQYSDAPMSMEDRLVNPLGFQVTGYRRDAESPEAPTVDPAAIPAQPVAGPAVTAQPPAARRTANGEPVAQLRGAVRMNVPVSQLPLGSPLAPGGQGQ